MIKAIIVDDELPSINILKRLLENSGKVQVNKSFDNAIDVIEYLKANIVDVIFLDIQMPDVDGLELANIITTKVTNKCKIVFVTAYNQYAIEAFEINALDYLLKPVKRDRLNKTLDRIIEELNIKISPTKMNVKCFGKFEVYADKKRVKFRTKKAEELLALLINNEGKSVPRSKIIDFLWADFDGDKALVNLNTTLYYVRKALQDHGLDIQIIFDRETYRIDTSNIICDYFAFKNYFTNSNIEGDISDINEILDLYKDDYFIANDYVWSISMRLSLKEKYISLMLLVVEFYCNNEEKEKAIVLLKDAFSKECINDAIVYKLMELLIEEKKYSLALKYYNSYKNTLKELGRKPNKIFKKLLALI
ncbi:response regulator [Vallitalea sp.]|jgi:two-component SAPR family response regulator|uniref:response regulator n=1 Tax=Vallitalea sp. TaxID=1882829 RepID=UPI0025F4246C|nr:response regulator [Vallitalea sp.]MCT4686314.1 response regulator [Vallitalea sp.]